MLLSRGPATCAQDGALPPHLLFVPKQSAAWEGGVGGREGERESERGGERGGEREKIV